MLYHTMKTCSAVTIKPHRTVIYHLQGPIKQASYFKYRVSYHTSYDLPLQIFLLANFAFLTA